MLETLKQTPGRRALLGEQLVLAGLVTQEQIDEACVRQAQSRKRLGETLLQMGYIAPPALGRVLEGSIRCQYVDIHDLAVDAACTQKVTEPRARRLMALPLKDRGQDVLVAMSDPLNLNAIDELASLLGKRITPVLAFESEITTAINRVYDVGKRAQGIIAEIGPGERPTWEVEPTTDELLSSAEDAPVVRLVNSIIAMAIANDASDIHIEPQNGPARVRFRIDGMLYDQMMNIPGNFRAAVVSRIKIMARCDISERRRPQDGRILYKQGNHEHDLRVSIMPTVYGEKAVIRILDRDNKPTNLEQMGFSGEQYRQFEGYIRRPYGMILVTGPTGSGKSTTLQAAITKINNPNINISTVEDPVEYIIPGVNHTQVDPKIGVNFASGLRTLVRQDPDVIMVGEIRDRETAEIAIQAAQTGHLVMSTMHTNDAAGAVTRLINMGVEPFLVASALLCVVGQRLVRTFCPYCREEVTPERATLEALAMPHSEGHPPKVYHGRGCVRCEQRGLKGRTAVYELMPFTEEIGMLTLQRASSVTIREMAVRQGMKSMRDSAVRKVFQGLIPPEEVFRVLIAET
jgi:type IV pilus assembly protein PilB